MVLQPKSVQDSSSRIMTGSSCHPAIKNDSGAILSARDGTIFVADAHRDDGKRFVVRADEKLTAFLEIKSAVEPFSAFSFL
jgi:hypothetical protein